MVNRCAFVIVIGACGGGGAQKAVAKEPTSQTVVATKSECAAMADHAAGVVLTFKDPPKASKDELAKVIETHCETDAWSADAKKCWSALATEADARSCVKLLTEDQHDKVMADFKARYGHDHDDEGTKMQLDEGKMGKRAPDVPTGAPPPPRAPAPAKAPKPKAPPAKGGGAPAKGDPCEGGE